MDFATVLGKEAALAALRQRREKNAEIKQIDNEDLPAGSPMYYYCISCRALATILPETHFERPPSLCGECNAMKKCGWLE